MGFGRTNLVKNLWNSTKTSSKKKEHPRECLKNDKSEESEAECPKCGLVYGKHNSLWIQFDSCILRYDLKCTQ